ncbi:MAG: VOC family protein [Chloroflexi bacterium]|nr:VOC family protein [Chloroflexota bacterium]
MSSIHPDTTLGYVRVAVSNVDESLIFYQNALGLQLRERAGNTAYLGAGADDIVVLEQATNAQLPAPATGLYHFAIRVPSRHALAQSLKNFIETKTPLGGFADHLVSEAIYLADPDGNGIEVYRDRPRNEWYDAHGKLTMATDPLDVRGLLGEVQGNGAGWQGMERGTQLGHMHLKVAQIAESKKFYCDVLGFDFVADYGPSAAFVSAGGYHHHIGMNTWESAGAPPPPPDTIGLRDFIVRLPNRAELDTVLGRVEHAGIAIEATHAGSLVRDPSQNGVVLMLAENT